MAAFHSWIHRALKRPEPPFHLIIQSIREEINREIMCGLNVWLNKIILKKSSFFSQLIYHYLYYIMLYSATPCNRDKAVTDDDDIISYYIIPCKI